MKKVTYLFIVVTILFTLSCEKDFDEENHNHENIELREYTFKQATKNKKFNFSYHKVLDGINNKVVKGITSRESEEIFTIDSTTIKEIVYNNKTTFTMLVKREEINEDFFENYVVEIDEQNNVVLF